MLYLQERRRLRLFLRQDEYRRYYSALVYLPRDRYTTEVRLRLTEILKEELRGGSVDFTAWNTESVLSRLHFVIRVEPGAELPELAEADLERIEARLVEAARSWEDGFAEALTAECGEERAAELSPPLRARLPRGLQGGLPARAPRSPTSSTSSGCSPDGDFTLSLYEPVGAAPGERRLQDLPHRRARCC